MPGPGAPTAKAQRDARLDDVEAYVRMRCDPIRLAELGSPPPRDGMAARAERDVRAATAGTAQIKMIVPDATAPSVVAGGYVTPTA